MFSGNLQEMRGATDAGVVVADKMLAFQGHFFIRERGDLFGQLAEIRFYGGLILAGGRHDPGRGDRAVGLGAIFVPADSARGLGAVAADARAGCDRNPRALGQRVVIHYVHGQGQCVDGFHAPGHEIKKTVIPRQRFSDRLAYGL